MHIKEHQSDIRTIIVNHFTDAYSCNTFCMQFSIVNDIVNSNEWANKVMELGWGAFIHTEESKRKISQKNKGRICSEATRKKISESHQGERNPMFGKKHTDKAKQKMKGRKCSQDTKRKMSESRKGERNHMLGKKHTDESKQKMKERAYGRKCSQETRKKMSESTQGERNPMYGKKHTEETKRKMSESQKRYYKQKSEQKAI
eukprot:993464_1